MEGRREERMSERVCEVKILELWLIFRCPESFAPQLILKVIQRADYATDPSLSLFLCPFRDSSPKNENTIIMRFLEIKWPEHCSFYIQSHRFGSTCGWTENNDRTVFVSGSTISLKMPLHCGKWKKHILKCISTLHNSPVSNWSLLANKTAACELLLRAEQCVRDWIAVWFRQTVLNSWLFMAQRPVLKIETAGQRPLADMLAMQLFNKTIWPNMQFGSWSEWFVLTCVFGMYLIAWFTFIQLRSIRVFLLRGYEIYNCNYYKRKKKKRILLVTSHDLDR